MLLDFLGGFAEFTEPKATSSQISQDLSEAQVRCSQSLWMTNDLI